MLAKKLRDTALATAAAGALMIGLGVGSASAITIDGIDFSSDSVFKTARIYENIILTPGDELKGIGNVTLITDSSGTTWNTLDNGRELTFTFDSYFLELVTTSKSNPLSAFDDQATLLFSGGAINFFSDDSPDFSFSSGLATNLTNATDGENWLNLVGAGNGLVCAGDLCDSADGTLITLQSTISIGIGGLATVSAGSGLGFLNVAAGAGSTNLFFDSNTKFGGSDFSLTSVFTNEDTGDYGLSGSADVKGVVVPEPLGIALFGFTLLGAAAIRKRKLQIKS